ncbi:TPA: hypothetical protein N2N62_004068 [Citrobacter freundii]|nr:hypothetical protein [Citrobacter freundii]HCL6564236.1 hypothetical protein [Citrobacter freundii]HED3638616.1 hypothetical protein [Citrobacter freundii]HED3676230.1 hypothetical protein [Citrobacter freundii]HED3771869.1 hypothetical protein [Citrobacter freundii]
MNVYEMEGFLRGKCLPGDMKVNESNAQYLVRKFSELQSQNADMAVQLANAESKFRELAAENAALKVKGRELLKEAAYVYSQYNRMVDHLDGESIDGQTLHEFQAVIEAETTATDAYLAEVRAQGVDASIEHLSKKFEGTGHIGVPVMALEWLAQDIRKGAAQ